MSEEMIEPCPFCGTDEHLSVSKCGSLTGDMPNRPYRVVCTHIDHDYVQGPVAYGRTAAIAAWNTRAYNPNERLREALDRRDAEVAKCPIRSANRYFDVCPKCKATTNDACGMLLSADYAFVEEIRSALSPLPQGED